MKTSASAPKLISRLLWQPIWNRKRSNIDTIIHSANEKYGGNIINNSGARKIAATRAKQLSSVQNFEAEFPICLEDTRPAADSESIDFSFAGEV